MRTDPSVAGWVPVIRRSLHHSLSWSTTTDTRAKAELLRAAARQAGRQLGRNIRTRCRPTSGGGWLVAAWRVGDLDERERAVRSRLLMDAATTTTRREART